MVKDIDVKREDDMHVIASIRLDQIIAGDARPNDGGGQTRMDRGRQVRLIGRGAISHMAGAEKYAGIAEIVISGSADVSGVIPDRDVAGEGRDENVVSPTAESIVKIDAGGRGIGRGERARRGAEDKDPVPEGVVTDAAGNFISRAAIVGALEAGTGAAIDGDEREEAVVHATRRSREIRRSGIPRDPVAGVTRDDQHARAAGCARAFGAAAAEEREDIERHRFHRLHIDDARENLGPPGHGIRRGIDRVHQRGVAIRGEGGSRLHGMHGKHEFGPVRRQRDGREVFRRGTADVGGPIRHGSRPGEGITDDDAFRGASKDIVQSRHRRDKSGIGRRHEAAHIKGAVVHDHQGVHRAHRHGLRAIGSAGEISRINLNGRVPVSHQHPAIREQFQIGRRVGACRSVARSHDARAGPRRDGCPSRIQPIDIVLVDRRACRKARIDLHVISKGSIGDRLLHPSSAVNASVIDLHCEEVGVEGVCGGGVIKVKVGGPRDIRIDDQRLVSAKPPTPASRRTFPPGGFAGRKTPLATARASPSPSRISTSARSAIPNRSASSATSR